MDNQHQLIKGYRDLTQVEIGLINEIKVEGERLGNLIAQLRGRPELDQRCVSLAYTDLQRGIMYAVRAVARPEGF
jgi:hypothetical protein